MALACQLSASLRIEFRKWTIASACLSVWQKAVLEVSPWCQTLQFLPACHWCLSNFCPSADLVSLPSDLVSLSKSVCGFFKRNCLGLQKFLLPTQSPLVSAARSCEDLSSWHWTPGLGGLVWSWDSWLPRYPFQIFVHHTRMWNQPIPHLHPSSQSGWIWFL